MVSLGLHLLTIVLGVIFVFLGHVKLTPQFFPEYHSQIRNEFGKLNKEFPFFHITGWRPYAKSYRLGVGIAEMSSGTLLLLGGGFFLTTYVQRGVTCDNNKLPNCVSEIKLWY
ncbi:unnamed protein product [Rotaria magnacalcarata]|uniref:Uncharacterized protein n=3 Tax=Rotaria magnacalcarata TaxID=392030 RepID=A0A819A921_9BILA|nr:unnamed protein product [Rotaria magnacalcarata]CAF3800593.1 unnamed protein product [Rotaria magnacalcarata]CAF5098076.1 unnamed protein product [Rotaria magnacalcarata]